MNTRSDLSSEEDPEPMEDIFHYKDPSITLFNHYMEEHISPGKQQTFLFGIYLKGFRLWRKWPLKYRRFFVNLVCSTRQQFLDFLRENTPLGALLYTLPDKDWFIKLINLYWQTVGSRSVSPQRIAFALSLGFACNLKMKYLADRIRYARPDSDELITWYKKVTLNNIDEM